MPRYPSQVKTDVVFRPQAVRLMAQFREVMRYYHYGLRTEEAYWRWIKGFIFYHNKRHPKEMGKEEIEAYLTHLAVNKNVALSTQLPKTKLLMHCCFFTKRYFFFLWLIMFLPSDPKNLCACLL